MNLAKDMDALRATIASPGDLLYHHLTDLMTALEEVTEESAGTTSPLRPLPPTPTPPSPPTVAIPMDQSKRRLKRRRSTRTLSETYGSSVERIQKLRRGGSPPINSESSPDQGSRQLAFTTPEVTGGDQGSESEVSGLRRIHELTGGRAHLITIPIESDSFTETPGSCRQPYRKKRFVKKMNTDSGQNDDEIMGHSTATTSFLHPSQSKGRKPTPVKNNQSTSRSVENHLESGVSSSDSETGGSDAEEGDDEESDWCWASTSTNPQDECMGIPAMNSNLLRRRNGMQWNGTQHNSSATILESSDTDVSQGSWPNNHFISPITEFRYSRRTLSKMGTAGMGAAANRRILQFLRNQSQTEFRVTQIRKKEKKQVLRLAAYYGLDVSCTTIRGRFAIILSKTKSTTFPKL